MECSGQVQPEPILNRIMSASRFQIRELTRISAGISRLFITAKTLKLTFVAPLVQAK